MCSLYAKIYHRCARLRHILIILHFCFYERSIQVILPSQNHGRKNQKAGKLTLTSRLLGRKNRCRCLGGQVIERNVVRCTIIDKNGRKLCVGGCYAQLAKRLIKMPNNHAYAASFIRRDGLGRADIRLSATASRREDAVPSGMTACV